MSEWNLRFQALTFQGPTPQWGHVGLGPGLIDEDEPAWVNPGLVSLPTRPLAGYVRTVLFTGQRRFF